MTLDILTTAVFDGWFSSLRDRDAKARIQMRIDRMQLGHFGDVASVDDKSTQAKDIGRAKAMAAQLDF